MHSIGRCQEPWYETHECGGSERGFTVQNTQSPGYKDSSLEALLY